MEVLPTPITVLLQVIPFLVTCFALTKIIFQPMLAYLDDRDAHIEGSKADAEELQQRVAERTNEYQERLTAARSQIADLRASRRAEAQKVYDARLAEARSAADVEISAALVKVDAERDSASQQLQANARMLANDIASQVLNRTVAAG